MLKRKVTVTAEESPTTKRRQIKSTRTSKQSKTKTETKERIENPPGAEKPSTSKEGAMATVDQNIILKVNNC